MEKPSLWEKLVMRRLMARQANANTKQRQYLKAHPWLRNKYFKTSADGNPAWRRALAKGQA